jgi:hypothetical protein
MRPDGLRSSAAGAVSAFDIHLRPDSAVLAISLSQRDPLLAKYEQVVAYRGLPGRAGSWGSENKAACRGLLWSGLWSAFSLVLLR